MKKVDQSSISKPLPPRCTYNHLNWRVVYFAILNVQFNILLFQLNDVTQPMPIYEGSQGDLSRGDPDDPSEFCQRPPESSGRWECPAIRRSVHINPRCQQTSADPRHVLPQQQDQPNSSVLLRQ